MNQSFLALSPHEFEELVAWVFEQFGYKARLTGKTNDHGIDIVLEKPRSLYAVQVKRWAEDNNLTEANVREFYGSFVDERIMHGGFLVTTSDFSPQAYTWARRCTTPLSLVHGRSLRLTLRHFIRTPWHAKVFGVPVTDDPRPPSLRNRPKAFRYAA